MRDDAAKHTPGPWSVRPWANYDRDGAMESCGYQVTASVGRVGIFTTTIEDDDLGDLHLIAAAPDLLAALQGVLRVADRATDEFDAARAAIAKATGKRA